MPCTAFLGPDRLAAGDLDALRTMIGPRLQAGDPILILDDETGRTVDLDLRRRPGAPSATPEPPEPPEPREPPALAPKPARGRPKLGVVAREVTLLPRHWDWLAAQPGGASAALRRLVEGARRDGAVAADARQAQEALHRAMTALAGDLPGYEDALRALYARDDSAFDAAIAGWPADIRRYLAAFAGAERRLRP